MCPVLCILLFFYSSEQSTAGAELELAPYFFKVNTEKKKLQCVEMCS